ncbi:plasmid partition protein ParG [Planctomycetaceae bacterium SH139]
MSKKVAIPTRPRSQPTVDQWVGKRNLSELASSTKPKRLTIDIDPNLHSELKIHCATHGICIADLVRKLIEDHFECSRS